MMYLQCCCQLTPAPAVALVHHLQDLWVVLKRKQEYTATAKKKIIHMYILTR